MCSAPVYIKLQNHFHGVQLAEWTSLLSCFCLVVMKACKRHSKATKMLWCHSETDGDSEPWQQLNRQWRCAYHYQPTYHERFRTITVSPLFGKHSKHPSFPGVVHEDVMVSHSAAQHISLLHSLYSLSFTFLIQRHHQLAWVVALPCRALVF